VKASSYDNDLISTPPLPTAVADQFIIYRGV
jgi:hypothetical protein